MLDELNNLADEAVGLTFSSLCTGKLPAPYDAKCPFNGMKAFDYDRREFFRARETLTAELAERLRADGLLAVVGPSGSGKSSIVLAGVIPRIGLAEADFVTFSPGSDPLGALDRALAAAGRPDSLLVVDQFEELFTHPVPDAVRHRFLGRLYEERGRRRLALTLRSEFRDRLIDTWLWPALSNEALEVGPMCLDELQRSMEEQAAAVGLKFEEGLVSEILGELDGEPGRMPLLQHTLRALWERRRGAWLKRSDYDELGGVHEAIARTADGFLNQLSTTEDVRRVWDLLGRMVRVADESDAANETRRRVRIDELVPIGEPEGLTRAFVNQLANEYLVITAGPEVEVAHEALIRHWQGLRTWVRNQRQDLVPRQSLASDARSWSDRGRPADGLRHRGVILERAEKLKSHTELKLNLTEVIYLTACRNAQRRAHAMKWAGLHAVILVPLVFAAGIYKYAEEQRRARENSELLAAEGLFRPLVRERGNLNEREVEALMQLGTLPPEQEGVRIKFLEHALSDSHFLARLANRMPVAIQAAVGLDPKRRDQVLRLLRTRLADPNASLSFQVAVARALNDLDDQDVNTNELSLRILLQAFTTNDQNIPKNDLLESLADIAAKILCDRPTSEQNSVASLLSEAFGKLTDPSARQMLARGLAGVADRLPAERAAELLGPAARTIASALDRETKTTDRQILIRDMAVVAKGLPSDYVVQFLDSALAGNPDPPTIELLAQILSECAERLPPKRAAGLLDLVGQVFATALKSDSHSLYRGELARNMARVVKRLPPEQATQLLGPAARNLASELNRETNPSGIESLANILVWVANGLPAERAAELIGPAARDLARALARETDQLTIMSLVKIIRGFDNRLPVERAAEQLGPAAGDLADAISKGSDPLTIVDLAEILGGVAERLPPDQIARTLTNALAKTVNLSARRELAVILGRTAKRLPAERAAELLGPIARDLAIEFINSGDSATRYELNLLLKRVFRVVPPDHLVRAFAAAVKETPHLELTEILAGVAEPLPPERAAELLGPTAQAFASGLTDTTDPSDRRRLALCLAEVAKRLPPNHNITRQLINRSGRFLDIRSDLSPTIRYLAGRTDLEHAVQWLEHPLCYGETVAAILSQIKTPEGKTFRTRWELVEWLQMNSPRSRFGGTTGTRLPFID